MSTSTDRRQVVGVDGSEGSRHAMAWAVARADQLGPVEPVSAWHYPWWAFVPTATNSVLPLNEEEFDIIARRSVDESLEGLDRENVLETAIVHGSAAEVLLAAGERASLIVVGTRGHGTVASGLLGSVSRTCANQATVPVAIIPAETSVEDRFGSVVVGFDGSEHAERALEWAVENTPHSSGIKVVHVWNPSATATAQTEAMTREQLSAESLALVEGAVEKFTSRPELADRPFAAVSESGDARAILRSVAQEADLLIIGARGRGPVAHLLLGSVSAALVGHPSVATVVVH